MKFLTRLPAALGAALFAAVLALSPLPAKAAGMSDAVENGLLALFFNATTFDDIAENDSTSPATSLYLSLHSADPTDSGNQTSNECAYTSYARVATTRDNSDWTVSGNSASLANNEDFPAATGSSCTATHFCVGEAATSTGALYFCGTISPNLSISDGVTPRLTTSTAITFD